MKLHFLLFALGLSVLSYGQITLNPCIENTNFTIVVLGSSTAAGSGPSHIDSAWVNKYRKSLQQINPNNKVINLAVGGFTTYRIMPDSFATPVNRPPVNFLKNVDKALSYNPNAIIVNLPSNDRGWPKEEQLNNFDTLSAYSNSFGVPMFICTTQPIAALSAAQYQKDVADSILNTFGNNAIDIFYPLADTNFTVKPIYAADAVHLNDQGHRVIHSEIMNADVLFKVYEVPNYADLALISIVNSSPFCTDTMATIGVVAVNLGDTIAAGNIINLSVDGTVHNLTSTKTLLPCQLDTVFTTLNMGKDSAYNLTAYVVLPNDSNALNDTIRQEYNLIESPQVMAAADTSCMGELVQFSSQLIKGDTLLYYANLLDTIPLDSLPFFTLTKDTNIYVQGVSGKLNYNNKLITRTNANIDYSGNMFNLVSKRNLNLTSVEIRPSDTGLVPITIYYKLGTYKGSEQNANAWTFLKQDTVAVLNPGDWVKVQTSLPLLANDTVGFYIHMTNSNQRLKYQSVGQAEVYNTQELAFVAGSGIAYTFGTIYFPRVINAKFNYTFGKNYLGTCATSRIKVSSVISQEKLSIGPDKTVPLQGDTIFASSNFGNFTWVHLETSDTVSTTNYAFVDSTFILQNPTNNKATLVCFGTDKWGCENADTAVITIDGYVGIEEWNASSFLVYPNPAQTEINIRNDKNIALSVLIYNQMGQLVISKNSNQALIILPVESITSGCYTIFVKTEKTSIVQKLIIRH